MALVSVVAASYNRGALLDRALATYAAQTLPAPLWEYLLVDDGSVDETVEAVDRWQRRGVPITRLTEASHNLPSKTPGTWRDGCALRNAASTFATGQFLVMTHPEILVPPRALQQVVSALSRRDVWVTAIPYWLPPMDDPLWGSVAWQDDLAALRQVPGFYDPSWPTPLQGGAIDYRNQHQERRHDWESEVWWGMRMSRWRWLGGFREFAVWGAVDMDFVHRRRATGITTEILTDPDSVAPSGALMVYHQFHDAPREMERAFQALRASHPNYSSPETTRRAGGLWPIYYHGPRERADAGVEGVLADHVLRYRWAARFCQPREEVLDVPCGTGYGSPILAEQGAFVTGIDLDEESVGWARGHHTGARLTFQPGSLTALPVVPGTIDQIVCFEGLEHVEAHGAVFQEFWRVLKPGGRWVISTPQRGVARGTPWDRFMVDAGTLDALVRALPWVKIEWFHQQWYGGAHPIKPGRSPTAEIQIVGATKP